MDKLDCSEVQASLPVTKWEFAKQHAIAARAWLDDTIGRCLQKHENTRSWMLDAEDKADIAQLIERGAAAVEHYRLTEKDGRKSAPLLEKVRILYTVWRPNLQLQPPTDKNKEQLKAYRRDRKVVTDKMLGEGRWFVAYGVGPGLKHLRLRPSRFGYCKYSVDFWKLMIKVLRDHQDLYPAMHELIIKGVWSWEVAAKASAEWHWGMGRLARATDSMVSSKPKLLHTLVEAILNKKIQYISRWQQLLKNMVKESEKELAARTSSEVRIQYTRADRVIDLNRLTACWEEALWHSSSSYKDYQQSWLRVAAGVQMQQEQHRTFSIVLEAGKAQLQELLRATPAEVEALCEETELDEDGDVCVALTRRKIDPNGKSLADEYGPNGKRQRLILSIDEGAFTKKWEMRFVETTPAFSGWRARGEKRWRLTAAREAAMGKMREEALLKAAGVDKLARA